MDVELKQIAKMDASLLIHVYIYIYTHIHIHTCIILHGDSFKTVSKLVPSIYIQQTEANLAMSRENRLTVG